jgi:hypothetical protein
MKSHHRRQTCAQISDISTIAEAKSYSTKEDMANTFRIAKVMQNVFNTRKSMLTKRRELEMQVEEKE